MRKNLIIKIAEPVLLVLIFICAFILVNTGSKIRVNALISPELVPVKIESEGVLKNIFVEPQQNVSKGQLIAEVEVQAPVNSKEMKTVKPNLPAAKANLNNAEQKYTSSALMYKDGVISQEDYDESLKNLTAAQEEYKAAVEKSKTIAAQEKELKDAVTVKKVYAPQDGIVYTNLLTKGNETNSNKPIVLLAINTPKVVVYADKKTASKSRPQQKVQIKLTEGNENVYDGIVEFVSDKPYNDNGDYVIHIGFKDNLNVSDFKPSQPVLVIFK